MSPIVDQKTKRCTKCNQEFPATIEFFYQRKEQSGTLRNACKECWKQINQERRIKNLARYRKQKRQYESKHSKEAAERHSRWVNSNREHRKKYARELRRRNPEKFRERSREWRRRNPERSAEFARRWAKSNPEKIRRKSSRRRAFEMQAKGQFTPADIKKLYINQRGRCWYCQTELGDDYHIDHRIPLSRGGSNDPSNLVLACPPCNLSKHNKLPDEWCGRLL